MTALMTEASDVKSAPNGKLQHLQGLRAVAVLAVMVYHAGLPLPGGFVGVDIFFVISGFIITLALMREWRSTGQISLRQFYWRRFRRIIPALAVTVSVTAVLTVLLLSPLGQQQATVKTGLASLFLVANWWLYQESGNYFGPEAEANALTHTWSLSVEEQFYIVFPITLLIITLLWKRWPRWGPGVAMGGVGLLAALSLSTLQGLGPLPPSEFPLGFYGPLTRAWEFLAGVLLALAASSITPRTTRLASLMSGAGLASLLVSFAVITHETTFPGLATLLPVIGAVVLLIGLSGPDGVVKPVLSSRPMVLIGDWSYSLYLWHWPLIVIAASLWPFWSYASVVACAVSVPVAYCSFRYVEEPLRHLRARSVVVTAKHVARVLVPAVAVLGASGVWSHVTYPSLLREDRWITAASNPEDAAALTSPSSDPVGGCRSTAVADLIGNSGFCTGPETAAVLVLGDSHAAHLRAGLEEWVGPEHVATWSYHASPRLFGGPEGIKTVVEAAANLPSVQVVVLGRRLARSSGGLSEDDPQNIRLLVQGLDALGKQVLVLDDVPSWPVDVSSCVWGRAPIVPGRICEGPRAHFTRAHELTSPQLAEILGDFERVHKVNSYWALCDAEVCRRADSGGVWYMDTNHLSAHGSKHLISTVVQNDPIVRRMLEDARAG